MNDPIIIRPEVYGSDDYVIGVDGYEGNVHLDCRGAEEGQPSLSPKDARRLAAVLNYFADEVER